MWRNIIPVNHFVRARIDECLKNKVAALLASMGLTISDFIHVGLTKQVNERGLPFDMHVPNQLTS